MKPENTEKLFNDFPLLFGHVKSAIENEKSKTSIEAFGFQCGDGWFDLIYNLCSELEKDIKSLPEEQMHQYRVFQVKEKFGGLRFYLVGAGTVNMQKAIEKAEKQSYKICEICGETGSLRESVPKVGWLSTRCDEHDPNK